MTKLNNFDVLIVYSESMAKSASDTSAEYVAPFAMGTKREAYNEVYGYFLEVCESLNLKAAFTTSADIVGPGFCRSFWKFSDNKWSKHNYPCFSELIFDKFSPTKKSVRSRRELLFSSAGIKPFNDPELFSLFFDKQKTYQKLAKYAIPTASIEEGTGQSIKKACEKMNELMRSRKDLGDFSADIIMKDKFGAGGRHVYRFKKGQQKEMLAVVQRNKRLSFIIQPFVQFDQGFCYQDRVASADIRLIYFKNKIIQSYIRVAKSGEFRCNEHQGGKLTYVPLEGIPLPLIEKSNLISELLDKKRSLYALDFIISNKGNVYFLEGNTGPGLDWNVTLRKNEIEAKKLIKMIVEDLALRTKVPISYPTHILN